jgi:hypothetical protein
MSTPSIVPLASFVNVIYAIGGTMSIGGHVDDPTLPEKFASIPRAMSKRKSPASKTLVSANMTDIHSGISVPLAAPVHMLG